MMGQRAEVARDCSGERRSSEHPLNVEYVCVRLVTALQDGHSFCR